jgi:hypothetical protein
MKKPILLIVLLVSGLLVLEAQVAPAGAPAKLTAAEIMAERDKYAREVRAQIAGREKEPAEAVFKNIKVMKGMPAGRLVAVMNQGYSQSLGVSCTHCHVPGEWEKEDKPQKEIAREMSRLTGTIRSELLPRIANLESKTPVVNCTTCHRGEIKPALELAPRP